MLFSVCWCVSECWGGALGKLPLHGWCGECCLSSESLPETQKIDLVKLRHFSLSFLKDHFRMEFLAMQRFCHLGCNVWLLGISVEAEFEMWILHCVRDGDMTADSAWDAAAGLFNAAVAAAWYGTNNKWNEGQEVVCIVKLLIIIGKIAYNNCSVSIHYFYCEKPKPDVDVHAQKGEDCSYKGTVGTGECQSSWQRTWSEPLNDMQSSLYFTFDQIIHHYSTIWENTGEFH